jgi:hypothetical protein
MLAGFEVLLVAIAVMLWPGAFHQISESGEATAATLRLANRAMSWA